MDTTKFAFLIHFRFDYTNDVDQLWGPLSRLPESFYRVLLNDIGLPSVKWGQVVSTSDNAILGINQMIPLNGEAILTKGHRKMAGVINKTIDKLVSNNYTTVGLGALTSPMTNGGLWLKDRTDIGITNGNAYTAVILYQAFEKLIDINPTLGQKVAIVGASGSVGTCLTKLLLKNNLAKNIMAIGRGKPKLNKLLKSIKEDGLQGNVEIHTGMEKIHEADFICLLTTSNDAVLDPKQLKKDVVILDGTQPRNTQKSLVEERPDVTVIDGGMVYAPGLDLKNGRIGLLKHHYYACFSETALLSIEGHKGHFCLGNPTLEQAEYITQLANKHKKYGFQLAPFISYGEKLTDSIYSS